MSESTAVLAKLKKDFGDGVGTKGVKKVNALRYPTGIFALDLGMGGGFPIGRLATIYGPESCGKTTLALLVIAHVQRMGYKAVFVDLENTLDKDWAEQLGVNTDDLIVLNPDTAEQVVDCVEAMMYALDVGIIVLDSLAAMVTENEINSEAGKMIVGGSALMVSKLTRKATIALSREAKRDHFPLLIGINQIRVKIGQMFGDPETTPGGNAWRFASSMTLRLYGKDEIVKAINPVMPASKKVSVVVKKWKVPILSRAIEYDLTLIPHNGFNIGQAPSWNTVANYLKQYDLLRKPDKGAGWLCMNVHFNTLSEIEDRYNNETELRLALQGEVIKREMVNFLPSQDDLKNAKVDKETGEILP